MASSGASCPRSANTTRAALIRVLRRSSASARTIAPLPLTTQHNRRNILHKERRNFLHLGKGSPMTASDIGTVAPRTAPTERSAHGPSDPVKLTAVVLGLT